MGERKEGEERLTPEQAELTPEEMESLRGIDVAAVAAIFDAMVGASKIIKSHLVKEVPEDTPAGKNLLEILDSNLRERPKNDNED